MIKKIFDLVAVKRIRGVNPTHIRMHPNTFKKIIPYINEDLKYIHYDVNAKIKLLGLTVWLDPEQDENYVQLLDLYFITKLGFHNDLFSEVTDARDNKTVSDPIALLH
jgi:hypothetical protein